jgi:hypothetical protein
MRNLHVDGYRTNRKEVKRLDNQVFDYLEKCQRAGRTSVRAGEVARRFSVDSCQALGSMERLKPRLRRAGVI